MPREKNGLKGMQTSHSASESKEKKGVVGYGGRAMSLMLKVQLDAKRALRQPGVNLQWFSSWCMLRTVFTATHFLNASFAQDSGRQGKFTIPSKAWGLDPFSEVGCCVALLARVTIRCENLSPAPPRGSVRPDTQRAFQSSLVKWS